MTLGRAYSNDIRECVVGAMLAGEAGRCVGARFGVTPSSVIKWRQRFLATKSFAPAKMGGHRPVKLDRHSDLALGLIERTPHLTLHKLVALLGAQGFEISHNGVSMTVASRRTWPFCGSGALWAIA